MSWACACLHCPSHNYFPSYVQIPQLLVLASFHFSSISHLEEPHCVLPLKQLFVCFQISSTRPSLTCYNTLFLYPSASVFFPSEKEVIIKSEHRLKTRSDLILQLWPINTHSGIQPDHMRANKVGKDEVCIYGPSSRSCFGMQLDTNHALGKKTVQLETVTNTGRKLDKNRLCECVGVYQDLNYEAVNHNVYMNQ